MIDFFNNFHFLRPYFLFFFLLPIFFSLKNIGLGRKVSSWENICDKNLFKFQIVRFNDTQRRFLKRVFYVGLFTTIISASGPAWIKSDVPQITVENPSMFVLSLADNMQLRDVTPTRLDRAKFMISDITENLPEGQYGLMVYSSEPYLITPITEDPVIIKNLLQQINLNIVPDNGDRLDRAIALAVDRFKAANYTAGNILLLASDVSQRFEAVLKEVERAKSNHYNVHVIDTSFSGSDKLKIITQNSGGVYLSVKEQSPQKLLQELLNKDKEKSRISENSHSDYLDYGYYLTFIPLFCLLFFFRRGLLVVLLLLTFSPMAHASFLLNQNQEALNLFNNQEYDKALEKFQDNIWKGIVLYKQNKPDEALREFSKLKNDISFYNSGVILTKECKYKEALEAFNEAVKLNPKNGNALYNKKVLEDLFEKAKENPDVLKCTPPSQKNPSQCENKENNNSQNENSGQGQTNQPDQNNESADSNNSNAENNNSNQNSDENESNKDNSGNDNNDNSQQNNASEQNNSQSNDGSNGDNTEQSDEKQQEQQNESSEKENTSTQSNNEQSQNAEQSTKEKKERDKERTASNSENNQKNNADTGENKDTDSKENNSDSAGKDFSQNKDAKTDKQNSNENKKDSSGTDSKNNEVSQQNNPYEQKNSSSGDDSNNNDMQKNEASKENAQKNSSQSEKNQPNQNPSDDASQNDEQNNKSESNNKDMSNLSNSQKNADSPQKQNINTSQNQNSDNKNSDEKTENRDTSGQNDNQFYKDRPSQKDKNERNEESTNKTKTTVSNQMKQQNVRATDADEDTSQNLQSLEMRPSNKGNEAPIYDEEALAIQRRYREIPEDVGGLLREFIKKEYLKDRYHD